jgi:hypothetical protein
MLLFLVVVIKCFKLVTDSCGDFSDTGVAHNTSRFCQTLKASTTCGQTWPSPLSTSSLNTTAQSPSPVTRVWLFFFGTSKRWFWQLLKYIVVKLWTNLTTSKAKENLFLLCWEWFCRTMCLWSICTHLLTSLDFRQCYYHHFHCIFFLIKTLKVIKKTNHACCVCYSKEARQRCLKQCTILSHSRQKRSASGKGTASAW